jgi:hypothetical protein
VPNSGKPEFGGHGARTILPTRRDRVMRAFYGANNT